jgi:predicted Zn finger-like uncharacterized protein
VLIRCDKCTTVYELDESVLPATGAPVQCSKCQFVFTAYRPSQPRQAPASPQPSSTGPAPATPPAPAAAESAAPSPRDLGDDEGAVGAPRPPAPAPTPRPAAAQVAHGEMAEEPKFTTDGRPIRKVAFPVEPPSAPRPAGAPVTVKPAPPRPIWLVVAAAVLVIALAVLAWRLLVHRPSSPGAAAEPEGTSGLLSRKESSHALTGARS